MSKDGREADVNNTDLLHHDFVVFLFFFFFLAVLRSLQDLSSPTRDRTHAPCSGSLES